MKNCIFCCEGVEPDLNGEGPPKKILGSFLTFLVRYIGCSFRTFQCIPPELELEALSLCESCTKILNSFCSLYHEVQCLELRLEGTLHNLISAATHPRSDTGAGVGGNLNQKGGCCHEGGGNGYTHHESSPEEKNIKGFREALIQTCSKYLSRSFPRVILKPVRQPTKSQVLLPTENNVLELKQFMTLIAIVLLHFNYFVPQPRLRLDNDVTNKIDGRVAVAGESNLELHRKATHTNTIRSMPAPKDDSSRLTAAAESEISKSFPCYLCFRVFSGDAERMKHLTEGTFHAKRKLEFRCHQDNQLFSNVQNLLAHFLCSHPDCTVYKCSCCGWPFLDDYQRELHELLHIKSVLQPSNQKHGYPCPICGISTPGHARLLSHYNVKHGQKAQIVKCSDCAMSFASWGQLFWHLRTIHKKGKGTCQPQNVEGIDNIYELSITEAEEIEYDNHEGIDCTEELKDPLEQEVCDTMEEKSFPCYLCSEVFPAATQRNIHLKDNPHPERKLEFKCFAHKPIKIFGSVDLLMNHFLHSHPANKIHKCSRCAWPFLAEYQLELHQLLHVGFHINLPNLHSGYPCPKCTGTYLPSYLDLLSHFNLAHGKNLKLFNCPKCHATPTSYSKLKSHLLIVHKLQTQKTTKSSVSVLRRCLSKLTPGPLNPETPITNTCSELLLKSYPAKNDKQKISASADSTVFEGESEESSLQDSGHRESSSASKIRFSCYFCYRIFHSEIERTRHCLSFHQGSAYFKCTQDKCTFDNLPALYLHYAKYHDDVEEIQKCSICSWPFLSSDRRQLHEILHIPPISSQSNKSEIPPDLELYSCPKCTITSKCIFSVQSHYNKIHGNNISIYTCPQCFVDFSSYSGILWHVKVEHQSGVTNIKRPLEVVERERKRPKQDNLEIEIGNVNLVKVEMEGDSPIKMIELDGSERSDMRTCEKDEERRDMPLLQSQIKTHFPCSLCPLSFTSEREFVHHLNFFEMHRHPLEFMCYEDNVLFSNADELRIHFQTAHGADKVENCSVCEWPFICRHRRELHELVHLEPRYFHGTRKYVCPKYECLTSFNDMDDLEDHYNSTHGMSFQIHTCSNCRVSFAKRCTLKDHLPCPSQYDATCEVTEEIFTSASEKVKVGEIKIVKVSSGSNYTESSGVRKLCANLLPKPQEPKEKIIKEHTVQQMSLAGVGGSKESSSSAIPSSKIIAPGKIRINRIPQVDQGQFVCQICGKVLPGTHMLTHHFNNFHRAVNCPVCGNEETGLKVLHGHIHIRHGRGNHCSCRGCRRQQYATASE